MHDLILINRERKRSSAYRMSDPVKKRRKIIRHLKKKIQDKNVEGTSSWWILILAYIYLLRNFNLFSDFTGYANSGWLIFQKTFIRVAPIEKNDKIAKKNVYTYNR